MILNSQTGPLRILIASSHPLFAQGIISLLERRPEMGTEIVGMVSTINEALEALKYLSGTGELLAGRLLFCDGESMQLQEISFDKDPECRVCGTVRNS